MANLFELVGEIAVRGAEASERAISEVDRRGAQLAESLDRAGQRTQRFGNGLSEAGDKATVLSGAMAAAGAGAAQYVTGVTQAAERSLELSERLGVNIEFMQTWQRVARRFGIEAEALRDGIKEVQLRADEFAETGSGPAAEAFERLGLSAGEVRRQAQDVEGFFRLVLDRIRDVEGAAARQRIADELFGGQAGEQFTELLQQSEADIQRLIAEVQASGGIFSEEDARRAREFNRELQSFQERLAAVGREVVIALLPQLRQILPVLESELVPALQGAAQTLGNLVQAFAALPGPMQQAIITGTALSVVLGPLLSIFGRLVSVLGSVISLFARGTRVISLIARPIAAVAGSLGSLAALVARFSGVLTAFWAGWEIGSRVIQPLIEMFPRLDRAIENAVGFVAVEVPRMLGQAWGRIQEILGNIVDGFFSSFGSIKDAVVARVSDMVDTVVGKVRDMWQALTGNSIIPRLADEAIAEFDRMGEGSERAGERIRRGMTDSVAGIPAPGAGGMGGAAAAGSAGAVNIDLSHSTFHDDQDMLDRLRRNGADVSGAFAA